MQDIFIGKVDYTRVAYEAPLGRPPRFVVIDKLPCKLLVHTVHTLSRILAFTLRSAPARMHSFSIHKPKRASISERGI
jgi:hypothetical protein